MHNFNMHNSQLFIKKVNLSQKVDLSHVKFKNKRTKSSITFKTKTKRPSLELSSKLTFGNQFNTIASLQSFRSSQMFTSRNSIHSEERRFHQQNKNALNNYQFFPKRTLLTKPHTVKNTKIALNLFGKKMIDNEERLSVLAQSLYKQLNEMRTSSNIQRQNISHTPRKPRVVTRTESAPFKRKESITFQPWEIGDIKQEENR